MLWYLGVYVAGVGTGWVVFEKPEWVREGWAWVKAQF